MEANPDKWFRYDMYGEMDNVRAMLATYINASPADVVFVDNASHGVNAVLRSLNFASHEKILYLNSAYQMVKNTLTYVHEVRDEQLLMVNLTFPSTDDEIVAAVVAALDATDGAVALASFSHIVSVPGVILPITKLIAACHDRGVMVLIDGAHALGQIPLDMQAFDADFYLGNGHKWLYSPKGSAFLWVRSDRQALIDPTVISWEGQGETHFQMAFSYLGTTDYSAYLAMEAALQFRARLGEDAIVQYIHTLAGQGGDVLAAKWGTERLVPDPQMGAMVNVRLPSTNSTAIAALPAQLLSQYNTWVPFYPAYWLEGAPAAGSAVDGAEVGDVVWYARVSAQIYLEVSDFEYLGDAVLALLAKK